MDLVRKVQGVLAMILIEEFLLPMVNLLSHPLSTPHAGSSFNSHSTLELIIGMVAGDPAPLWKRAHMSIELFEGII